MVEIAAGVVLFNPDDVERVKKCLSNVARQVEKVYIYDNSTASVELEYPDNCVYLTENANLGIAHALNVIMRKAQEDGYKWVITMDQDSIMPLGMIESFKTIIEHSSDRLGIICPQVIDRRRIYSRPVSSNGTQQMTNAITSASCTSVKAWEEVGEFDEWLFIDLVDNEFSKRLTCSGYQILRVNKWILDQEFGVIEPKTRKKQIFWMKASQILHVPNLAKFAYRKKVSPFRVYYVHRNIIYINRKLKKYGTVGFDSFGCKSYLGFFLCYTVPSVLRAQDKKRVMLSIVHGINDGLHAHPSQWISPREAPVD